MFCIILLVGWSGWVGGLVFVSHGDVKGSTSTEPTKTHTLTHQNAPAATQGLRGQNFDAVGGVLTVDHPCMVAFFVF